MNDAAQELGEFLQARRARLEPGDVGLPDTGGRRRVPGLRREEVAVLVSISPDYYTRLEQGRRRASESVLQALATALRLDDAERTYLFELAGRAEEAPVSRPSAKASPQLRRILEEITSPAFVLGPRMDVLAWNSLAAALVTDWGALDAEHRNYVRVLFADPAVRALHRDWRNVAQQAVAMLRREAGQNPQDRKLAALVGELSVSDADFRRWWADHHVAMREGGTKRLRHPEVGDLVLDWTAFTVAGDTSQQLVVWSAEPRSEAHEKLRLLGSLTSSASRNLEDTAPVLD